MARACGEKFSHLGESKCLVRISKILDRARAPRVLKNIESKSLPLNPSWLSAG
jgi:hypothetical protein